MKIKENKEKNFWSCPKAVLVVVGTVKLLTQWLIVKQHVRDSQVCVIHYKTFKYV